MVTVVFQETLNNTANGGSKSDTNHNFMTSEKPLSIQNGNPKVSDCGKKADIFCMFPHFTSQWFMH